jgi:CDP-diacylglycerol--serine O-phosphatidyltransferase
VRRIAILPTLLTLGNGACGFAAIVYASRIGQHHGPGIDPCFALAGWMILLAMVFDAFDGYVARLSRTTSKFGAELDSLCDVISFGVAPAFLLLRLGPGWEPRPILHQALTGIALLYMVCAVLRLARYNVDSDADPASRKRFRGLPSPGAAGCLASLAILRGELPKRLQAFWPDVELEVVRESVQRLIEVCAPLGALAVALLMVSRVPYPHVTKQVLRGRRHFSHLIQIILLAFVVLLIRELAVAILFWAYALGILARYLVLRALKTKEVAVPSLDDVLPR